MKQYNHQYTGFPKEKTGLHTYGDKFLYIPSKMIKKRKKGKGEHKKISPSKKIQQGMQGNQPTAPKSGSNLKLWWTWRKRFAFKLQISIFIA